MLPPRTLLASVAEEVRALRVLPDTCARAETVAGWTSPCTACVEVCPHGAIALDPLELDEDRCDGCGTCAAACPTQALAPGTSHVRDAFRLLATRPQAEVSIACTRSTSSERAQLVLPCLAALPWELPASLALRGATQVALSTGDCASCAHAALAPRVDEQCAAAERAAQAVGRPGVLRVAAADPEPTAKSTRRGLLRGLLRRGHNVAERAGVAAVDRFVEALTDEQAAELDPLWLRKLLARTLEARDAREQEVEVVSLPRAATPVIGDACAPCPLCAASCPTNALTFTESAGELTLTLRPELCTDCRACEGVCPKDALDLSPTVDLASWGQTRPLVSARAGACASCGEPALSVELPYCPRCYREGRALRPAAAADSDD